MRDVEHLQRLEKIRLAVLRANKAMKDLIIPPEPDKMGKVLQFPKKESK